MAPLPYSKFLAATPLSNSLGLLNASPPVAVTVQCGANTLADAGETLPITSVIVNPMFEDTVALRQFYNLGFLKVTMPGTTGTEEEIAGLAMRPACKTFFNG